MQAHQKYYQQRLVPKYLKEMDSFIKEIKQLRETKELNYFPDHIKAMLLDSLELAEVISMIEEKDALKKAHPEYVKQGRVPIKEEEEEKKLEIEEKHKKNDIKPNLELLEAGKKQERIKLEEMKNYNEEAYKLGRSFT